MTSIQRMIKSGIRIYNHNPRGINFVASPINRLNAAANPHRSLCSGSCGDGHSMRTFNVDTSAMVKALKAKGIPLKKAEAITSSMTEFLAELEKAGGNSSSLLKSKFERLRENIKFDKFTPQKIVIYDYTGIFLILGLVGSIIGMNVTAKKINATSLEGI